MNYIKYVISVVVFLVGLLMGFLIRNFPLIKWNHEIKIYEVLQIIVTIGIGIIIPFTIKKFIDDKRQVKNLFVDDFKSLLLESKKIKDKIESCYQSNSISQVDKESIVQMFNDVDVKVNNLRDIFTAFYPKEDKLYTVVYNEYINYWKGVTGGSLVTSSFTRIDEQFYADHKSRWVKLEREIKISIIKVNQL